MKWFFRRINIEVYHKSAMETRFPHVHVTIQWQSHSGQPIQSNYVMLHCKKRVLRVNNHNIHTCHSAKIGITAKLKQTQAEMNSALLWRSEKHRKWKERDKIQGSEFIWIHLWCFNRSAFNATVPQSSVGGAWVIRQATTRTCWNTYIVQRKEQEQGREENKRTLTLTATWCHKINMSLNNAKPNYGFTTVEYMICKWSTNCPECTFTNSLLQQFPCS